MGTNRLLLSHKEEWHKVIYRHMTGARDYGKKKKKEVRLTQIFFSNK